MAKYGWYYDEKTKKYTKTKTPDVSASEEKSSSGESDWKKSLSERYARAAAKDYDAMNKNMPGFTQSFGDNRYALGGSAAIQNSGVIPKFETYSKYAPIISQNLKNGADYLGMSEEELAEYQKNMLELAEEALRNQQAATARTGGISSIDTSGMKKAEVQALGRMDKLYQFDEIQERQKQFSSRDEAEAAGVDIYGGMTEKEYMDWYTAHLREQQREKMAGAEAKRFEDQANELAASAQGDGKYVQGKDYWRTLDRGLLNSGLNEFNIDGEVLTYDEYIQKAEKSYINDYMGAVLSGDDDTIIELMDVGSAFPELQSKFSVDALAYADKEQAKTAINYINNDDMEGLYNYLGKIDYDISKAMVTDWTENATEWANKSVGNQILGTVASFPMNLVGGIAGAADDVAGLLENFDWYKNIVGEDVHSQANAGRVLLGLSDVYRGEMGQTIADATPFLTYGSDKNLANTAFQGIASLGDSMLSMAGGPVLQAVSMFGQEAGRTLYDEQDKGNKNAAIYATGVGAIAAAMEKLGVDSLFKGSMKKAMLGNAGEEGLTEIATTIYDIIVNGKNSEYNTLLDQYQIYGYGDKSAFKVAIDKALDVGEAALGGMFAGAVGGVPDAINVRNEGKNLRTNEGADALMDLADTLPVNDQAKDIIRRMKAENAAKGKGVKAEGETVDAAAVTKADAEAAAQEAEQTARDRKEISGKKKGEKAVSNAEIGYLYRETMRTVDAEAQNVVANTLAGDVALQLSESGFTGDVKKAARDIVNFISGKTDRQTMRTIEGSSEARRIALEYTAPVDRMMRAAERRSRIYELAGDVSQRARKDFVKPETTKAEKGAGEATKGIEDRAVITAADVEIADTPESTVDGQAVTIEGVASVSNVGTVTYTIKDSEGNTREVSEDDVSIGQNDAVTAVLVENARELGANADAMIRSYVNGQDVQAYAEAFKQALQYGEDGWNQDVVKGREDMKVLNETQIATAYEIGRGRRTFRNTRMTRKNTAGIKVGNVDTSQINMHDLNAAQLMSVRSMSSIAKAVGFNLRFVESKADAKGRYTTENGSWDPETLTLTLDVHAGSNRETDTNYAMMHTAGHELTHYIRQFADGEMWNAYQEFVIGHLSTKDGKGFDLENAITAHIKNAREQGRYLDRDAAIEEVIANASGDALNRITEADLSALAQDNPGLFNKIREFFSKWISILKKTISAAYKGAEARTEEAQQMMDAVDEMGRRWNELLLNATKNRRESAKGENVVSEATTDGVEVSESGDTAYVDADAMYSLRTFNESDYVTERDKAAAALAKKMGVTIEKAEAYIDDVTGIAAMVAADRDRLDFEAENEYTALKHNSEYKFTVDFSTLCKKRLMYTGTFDAIQKQMPETALTEDDYIRLRQMMADRGYEVACAFCYVESRRKNNGEIINKFLDVYKNAQKTGGQMELGPRNRKKAFKVEDGFTPNIADFNTSEGIANIMHNHRGVYDAYMYFMNARGVSKPKLIESRTEYTKEILQKFRSASAVRAMNKRGGLRLQSFSDFEVVNMLDMMQVVMDMSRVGLMSQAYTKVPAFARVFGGTGVKINLSLVTKGVDKNGKLIFDDIEGMPHEEAFKIRDMYSEHVGTILVGKDDATIKAAMADPRIDFIIPYHASGWSTENQNALGIGGYTNFTAEQNETSAATGKGVKNFQPSEYWDYSKTGDENAQIYLEKCREAGRVPKFPQYQNYPGYWKMLIDFKMYDNDGNGSPQRAVRPDYNLSEAKRIMNEYTGGHQNLPVAHDVVRDFVKEYQGKGSDTKYSIRETDDGRKVVAVEDDILKGIYSGGKWTEAQKEKAREAAKAAISSAGPIYSEGIPFYINARTKKEFPSSKYVWNTLGKTEDELADRFRISSETENLVLATVGWKDDPLTKNRTDFVKFVKGKVYMEIKGHKYEGTVVAGVNSKGKHVLYDLVDMNTATFKMKEEDISSTDQANAATDYSKMSSTLSIIAQNSKAGKAQMRNYDDISDRELLVRALDTELTPAERGHLERYKGKMDKLSKDQRELEKLNSEIVQLRQAGKTQKNSEELRKAMTNATTLRGRIDRTDAELNQIESAAMIKEIIRRNRVEASRSKATSLREWQEKEKYRKMLVTDAKKLHKWIVSPTSKGYTPEFLREPVAKFLETVDFTSKRALGGGEDTWNDQKFKDALEELRDAIGKLGNQQSDIDGGAQSFMGYIDLPANYVQNFNENISAIRKALDVGGRRTDTPVNRMTAAQMRELAQAFRVLNSSIMKVNTLVSNARYSSAKLAADETIDDMNELRARRKTNKVFEVLNTTFNWKNTTPYYAFQRMGRGAKAIFESLQDGWDKMAQNSATVIEFSRDTFTAKESQTWAKEISTVELDNGESVQMTTAQKMSLYCLSKRPQATGHLLGGGIRVADIEGKRGNKISQAENYTLTIDDIGRITGSLTDRQKEVADALQRFMSDQCAKWGNEISMKRFGFNQMTELFYFPIETDANNRARIDEAKDGKNSMFRLLNMSSLKPLTPNANNAIVIHDIFDVFAGHASDMAKYNALALPILDFIKWYNHVERTEVRGDDGKTTGQITTRSTQKALERAFGQDAKSYLTAFIKDLNAEHDGGRNDGLINSIVGRAKSAAVGANLRVYGLQITSLPRAAYAINPVYLAKGLAKVKSLNPVNAVKGTEAQEKVGILKWKDLGFYSTDIGRSTRGMVKRDEGILGKIRDWSMAPAGWGDNWVSNIIYEAAKAEMKAKHPEIRPGSAEYERRLNKRVREIVYKTQVVDSTMTRSDFMRSKGLASTLTAFMSEPTLTVNMLNESIQKAVETGRKGGNFREILRASSGMAVRAATTFAVTACITSLMESMFDALRDDDEYETFRQKFMDALWGTEDKGGNLAENFNIFAMLPYIKDVISIFQGYENSSLITQGWQQVQDFKTSIESWQNGKAPIYRVVYNGAKAASSMGGIAVGNAMRDFVSMYNTWCAPAWGTPKWQTYEDNETTAATAYYEAIKAGDTERAEYYRERMDVTGMDMEKVEKKIATLAGDDYVAGSINAKLAKNIMVSEGAVDAEDLEDKIAALDFEKKAGFAYGSMKKKYTEGIIDRNKAINYIMEYEDVERTAAQVKVNKWQYEIDTKRSYSDLKKDYVAGRINNAQLRKYLKEVELLEEEKIEERVSNYDYYAYKGKDSAPKYWRLAYTYETGGNYEAYADEIFKEIMDTGKSWKQARSSIASSLASYYKKDYLAVKGTAAGDRMLEQILDVYEAIGYDRAYERKYIADNWELDD